MKKTYGIVLVLGLIAAIVGAFFMNRKYDTSEISKTGMYFDTVVSITLYNSEKKYIDECFDICERYEKLFDSGYAKSDVFRINQSAGSGEFVEVDEDTLELIKIGIQYSKLSDGSFDITLGRLSSLWGFDSFSENGGRTELPDESEIESIVSNIGFSQIEISNNKVRLTNKDSNLDLGGIAKGYVADKLKEYLKGKGVKNGIINLGGNILLIGNKPNNSNFNIGIQKPFRTTGEYIRVVNAKNKSIVTSGTYERYYEIDGNIYHHILDAKTGYPVDNELSSVTIISDKSVDGDALSTLIFTKGLEEGIYLIEQQKNIEAVFVNKSNQVYLTSGLTETNNTITIKK